MYKDSHGRNWYPKSGYRMLDDLCKVLSEAKYPIVIYDTETTGTSKNSYVVQYAGIRVEPINGQYYITDSLNQLIKPPIPMPKGASDVNHITDDMLKDQPAEAFVIDKIISFMANAYIGGYNHISFDNGMMNNMSLRTKGLPFPNLDDANRNFDALKMSRCLVGRNQVSDGRMTLGSVSELYGIHPDEDEMLHDALADTKVTMKLMWALAREYHDSEVAKYFRSLTNQTPEIKIYKMTRLTYSKTSDYVIIDVACLDRQGQIRYEVYDKRYVEMSGDIMELGNMEQFIIDADKVAGGDIAKFKPKKEA